MGLIKEYSLRSLLYGIAADNTSAVDDGDDDDDDDDSLLSLILIVKESKL
jgi:hypothetical protein